MKTFVKFSLMFLTGSVCFGVGFGALFTIYLVRDYGFELVREELYFLLSAYSVVGLVFGGSLATLMSLPGQMKIILPRGKEKVFQEVLRKEVKRLHYSGIYSDSDITRYTYQAAWIKFLTQEILVIRSQDGYTITAPLIFTMEFPKAVKKRVPEAAVDNHSF